MTENKPGREGNACNGDHCGMCCGGCCGCTMPELTREEADFLLTFAQLPFQPVVSRADLQRPVYAAESPSGEGDPAENISPETISSLADKYLIRIDYDIPLGNYSYRGFESYPLHGSMALTYRGQQVMDDLFRQDLDRSAEWTEDTGRENMIYLDYSANTPVDPAVLEAFVHTETAFFGNPNSAHPAGKAAREKLAEATNAIAALLDVQPSEIIYTSGASEANNLAVKGIARTQRSLGKHIISTSLEHPSVSGPLTWLQEQGYEIDLIDIGRDGKIDTDHLRELLRDDTILTAITAVDSELGVIQPVREISEIVHRHPNCRLHVDATQAIGKIPFSFAGPDTVSLAAHKFYGLNGSGVLFRRNGLVLDPLIHGGSGTSLYRSGTPALALAAALESALRLSLEQLPARYERVTVLNRKLREALSRYPFVRINSPKDAVPHILNVSVSGVKGTKMQQILSEHGVCVSVKSACSSEGTPSKAVFAVSRDRKNALSSWRISLSHLTTDREIEEFLELFDHCTKELAL